MVVAAVTRVAADGVGEEVDGEEEGATTNPAAEREADADAEDLEDDKVSMSGSSSSRST